MCRPEFVLRPIDAANPIEIDTNLGTSDGEVVEDLGVNVGERGRPPLLSQVLNCRGCRVARIVPAAEGNQENRTRDIGGLRPAKVGKRVA